MAVNILHENNIMHRDIKLENLIFKNSDSIELKLVDFGLAETFNKVNKYFINFIIFHINRMN